MSEGKPFEKLKVWQRARRLAADIYRLTGTGLLSQDFGLRDQMRRAAVSVMANIAEGFERDSYVEFRRYLSIAKGSCGELRSHLIIAFDVGYVPRAQVLTLCEELIEVSRMLAGLRAAISRRIPPSKRKGSP